METGTVLFPLIVILAFFNILTPFIVIVKRKMINGKINWF